MFFTFICRIITLSKLIQNDWIQLEIIILSCVCKSIRDIRLSKFNQIVARCIFDFHLELFKRLQFQCFVVKKNDCTYNYKFVQRCAQWQLCKWCSKILPRLLTYLHCMLRSNFRNFVLAVSKLIVGTVYVAKILLDFLIMFH